MQNFHSAGEISLTAVIGMLGQGVQLAFRKECRLFVIIPILVNIVIMTLCGYLIFNYLMEFIYAGVGYLPDFLNFLAYIAAALLAVCTIFVGCYFFSTIATIIASPFYGFLAEKVQCMLSGQKPNDDDLAAVIRDIPRILLRELQKQAFFLPRALACLIITLIPGINIIAPLLWFLLTAWMACIQYADYAFDNNKTAFKQMQSDLKGSPMATFGFGAIVAICISVPVLNLIVPPCAVCAGTRYYIELRQRHAA